MLKSIMKDEIYRRRIRPSYRRFCKSKLDEQDNGYKRARQEAYPSIPDQLDMMYHDQVDGTTTWKDAIADVKSDNPKPS